MEEHLVQDSGLPDGYTLFLVSDGSGRTIEGVVRAALTQFSEEKDVGIRRFSDVRRRDEVLHIVRRAAESGGIVLHTLVLADLRQAMVEEGRRRQVEVHDVMGPVLDRLKIRLNISPKAEPGLFHQLDEDYYRRIEAVDYTVKHDDGQHPADLPLADIVLVGVSRTCKTPLSIFLSYRGWRVANVPVVPEIPLPRTLDKVDVRRVVALTMNPEQLRRVRTARVRRMGHRIPAHYVDPERIMVESRFARGLYRTHGWPIVDVTNKSLEEIASEVLLLVRRGEA